MYSAWSEGDFSDIDQGSLDATEHWLDTSGYIYHRVYGYEHGGQTVSINPFSCPWDSGLLGFIAVHKDKIRQEFGWKRISQKREDQILSYLEGEVKTFAQYLEGDVYGYRIFDEQGEEVDSCWGYYGRDAALEEAQSIAESLM
jgi:hypothetical protein